MVDEQELRRVNWTEVFGFTHVFKSFRMAMYRSSMLLGLAAIILVYLLGRGMDGLWSLGGGEAQVGDVYAFYQAPNGDTFAKAVEARKSERSTEVASLMRSAIMSTPDFTPVRQAYTRQGGDSSSFFGKHFYEALNAKHKPLEVIPPALDQQAKEDWKNVWNRYRDNVSKMLDEVPGAIKTAKDQAEQDIKNSLTKEEGKKAHKQLDADVVAARRAVWTIRRDMIDRPKEQLVGRGPFCVLMNYETQAFSNAISGVRHGNFFSGWDILKAQRAAMPVTYVPAGPAFPTELSSAAGESVGFFGWLFLMFWGLVWLLNAFPLYAVFFFAISLAIWAIFGGGIARVAALHAAREEKISMGMALRFSLGKFFSFFAAPLIPLAIIVILGILLGVGGLIGALPVGDIIVSILFFGALMIGALVAFLAIGLAAGAPLMYPTIAVEGSDSFDAISRSFSYLFARPWRYALYVVVAVIYGAITYLFVRFFAFLLLLAAHFLVANGIFGTGMSINSAPELAEGASKMDLLWTKPTFDNLVTPMNSGALSWNQSISSFIIHIWVYLVVALVASYVLSYAVSSFTVIYYLLRRKVDATDLDDVYVEEPQEEISTASATAVPVTEAPPAAEPPAAPPQA